MKLAALPFVIFVYQCAVLHAAGNGDGILQLGADGYASLPDSQVQGFDGQKDFSLEAALNIEANAAGGSWPILLGKKYSPPRSDPGFALSIKQGQYQTVGQQVYAVVSDGAQQASLTSRSFQGTTHALMTWDAANKVLRLYINGALEGSATNSHLTGSLKNGQDLKLGGASPYARPLQRDLFLARLWNRVLTSEEVSSIWSRLNTHGRRDLPSEFNKTALISEWLLNGDSNSTELKDAQDLNPLLLHGSASLWQGNGPLTLQFPANGAANVSKSVTLKAGGGTDTLGTTGVKPLHYSFQVDETSSFNSPALKNSGWMAGYATWKPLLKPSTRYYWRVRVRDSSPTPVVSEFTNPNSFTTKEASAWYVRPGVYTTIEDPATYAPNPQPGVYGAQNGTSYENAWNGLVSIVWGENGVEPGDTLYLCGLHYWARNISASYVTTFITESGYSDAHPITIRMDYPADPGTLWGVYQSTYGLTPTWHGPDANGVYWSTNQVDSADYCLTGGTNMTVLDRESSTTWKDHLGASFRSNGTWYVKTPDGKSPAGRIFRSNFGYRLNLGRSSYIHFYRCRFYNAVPGMDQSNHDPAYDTQTSMPLSSHITFDSCDLRYNAELTPTPGNDYWTIKNSELAFSGYGIYTILNRRDFGANYLTVVSNFIHDLGTPRFPHMDGHGVGVQGGTGHLIQGNHIENTGTAICFWTGNAPMTNHTVCYNFIKNVRVLTPNGGCDGISISGENAMALPGLRTGFKVFGNIIINPNLGATESWQGRGISCSSPDYIEIYNNVVHNARVGIWISVSIAEQSAKAKIVNNIVVNPLSSYIWASGSAPPTNLLIDYNLYYPVTGLTSQFTVYPFVAHNGNSIFADPLFVSLTPEKAADFRLQSGSKAIRAGLAVGLERDFAGTPIPTGVPPDIGAYQFVSSNSLAAPQNVRVLKINDSGF